MIDQGLEGEFKPSGLGEIAALLCRDDVIANHRSECFSPFGHVGQIISQLGRDRLWQVFVNSDGADLIRRQFAERNTVFQALPPGYSWRRASMGLSAAARRAGK